MTILPERGKAILVGYSSSAILAVERLDRLNLDF
jgi:hypothetical protein